MLRVTIVKSSSGKIGLDFWQKCDILILDKGKVK